MNSWIKRGSLSVAEDRSKLYSGAPSGTRFSGFSWLKVPSIGNLRNTLKIQSWNGDNNHCVIGSTIAKTLTFPAGSCLNPNFPTCVNSLLDILRNRISLRPEGSSIEFIILLIIVVS